MNFIPRKARVDHAGLTHHIMVRTSNDLSLFIYDAGRAYYIKCLAKRIHEAGCLCHAWLWCAGLEKHCQ